MNTFNKNTLLGDIVSEFPGAADFFIERQIDFCCGGDRSLEAGVKEQGLSLEETLEALNQAFQEFKTREEEYIDWANANSKKLIDHILLAHHQYLKEELPQLSLLIFKLLRVHGDTHSELFDLHALMGMLRTELESHLVKEELWLFPLVEKLENATSEEEISKILKLIDDLEEDHDTAGDALKKLRELTDHYTAPADGCTTYNHTFERLRAFEKNMFEHVHLENNVMFKKYK